MLDRVYEPVRALLEPCMPRGGPKGLHLASVFRGSPTTCNTAPSLEFDPPLARHPHGSHAGKPESSAIHRTATPR
jgi:hypothetical protein